MLFFFQGNALMLESNSLLEQFAYDVGALNLLFVFWTQGSLLSLACFGAG